MEGQLALTMFIVVCGVLLLGFPVALTLGGTALAAARGGGAAWSRGPQREVAREPQPAWDRAHRAEHERHHDQRAHARVETSDVLRAEESRVVDGRWRRFRITADVAHCLELLQMWPTAYVPSSHT